MKEKGTHEIDENTVKKLMFLKFVTDSIQKKDVDNENIK